MEYHIIHFIVEYIFQRIKINEHYNGVEYLESECYLVFNCTQENSREKEIDNNEN